MGNKKLKKEYDKKLNQVMLRLSLEEKIVLKKKMEQDQWTNVAGWIKWRIFGNSVLRDYAKTKHSTSKEDIALVMQNLLSQLVATTAYINYRFNLELEKIEKADLSTDIARKLVSKMTLWKNTLEERSETLLRDIQEILYFINVRTVVEKKSDIENLPDEILEKALEDWNNSQSPEIMELISRRFRQFQRRLDREYETASAGAAKKNTKDSDKESKE